MPEPDSIEIVDAIDNTRLIQASHIHHVLNQEAQTLQHGAQFTGRPTTHIFSDEAYVVKLRSEFTFRESDARRWIERTLEHERAFGVHHPAKTWFLIHRDEKPVIANISPRLRPLHQIRAEDDPARFLGYLNDLLDAYFKVAKKTERHLDEGLSNFGLDARDHLYYLDDETYPWNDFTSFANALGVYLRSFDWLRPEQAATLGHDIQQKVLAQFRDPHWAVVIAEQIRGIFLANAAQEENRTALINALYTKELIRNARSRLSAQETVQTPPAKLDAPRIAVLADVHANLPALEAVLAELKRLDVRQGIILGDVVGYGPHPRECIAAIRESGLITIKGNHDHAVAIADFRKGFSSIARWVMEWTLEQVSDEEREWLGALPPYYNTPQWIAVHGAPQDKSFFYAYVYKMTYEDNLNNLQQREIPLCFHGHTHMQGIYYRENGQDHHTSPQRFDTRNAEHSLVCPGSVGQPRGNVPGAEFALFDTREKTLELRRTDYDMDKTIADLNRLKFPPQLATRLLAGK